MALDTRSVAADSFFGYGLCASHCPGACLILRQFLGGKAVLGKIVAVSIRLRGLLHGGRRRAIKCNGFLPFVCPEAVSLVP